MVTIDAAGCQTAIVQALRRKVKAAFDTAEWGDCASAVTDRCETVKRNSGRPARCRCAVLGGPGLCQGVADPEQWPGLRSLIRVQAERNGPRGRRQCSVRHCISSRPADAEALPGLVRGHWSIENGLHRTLDMQFREDDCRRKGHAPAVMAVL